MARINPKLNLNKTPQNVEDTSLVFAKNIKLNKELSICPDSSVKSIKHWVGEDDENPGLVGKIVGVNNKVYFFTHKENENAVNNNNDNWTPDWRNSGGYIENQINASFIDINYIPNYKTKLRVKVGKCTSEVANTIIASRTSADVESLCLFRTGSGTYYDFYWGNSRLSSYFATTDEMLTTSVKTIEVIPDLNGNASLLFNGINKGTQNSGTWNGRNSLKLFAWVNDTVCGTIQIYSLEIWDNGTLVREMYPAIVNNVPCMYDYVTDTYFYNQGTGNFTVSQEVIDASIPPEPEPGYESSIFEYDELTEEVKKINCSWKYNNGEITGCVTVNNTGEEILTIAEYNGTKDIPIKHINLSQCSENDDESIYTMNPNIPITNLNLIGYYTESIPNGVYQFFIRYKIRDNFYTNWFPATKECFSNNSNVTDTIQGTLRYVDLNRDSNKSFIFQVEHLFKNYIDIYEEFQIGFILSNDNGLFARSWKSFKMNITNIYFNYRKNDIEEINIDDLLRVSYDIYNVKNIIQYKNKLYVANYKESDFNPILQSYAEKIKINIKVAPINVTEGIFLNNIRLFKSPTSNYYDKYSSNGDYNNISDIYGNELYNNISYEIINVETTIEENSLYIYNPKDTISVLLYKVYLLENDNEIIIPTAIDQRLSEDDLTRNYIINKVENEYVKPYILGLNDNNNVLEWHVNTLTSGDKAFDCYYIKYVKVEYNYIPLDSRVSNHYKVIKTRSEYTIKRNCNINTEISETSTDDYNLYNTLIPYTSYEFYIHYVKQNGFVTNGYSIGEITLNQKYYWSTINELPVDAEDYGVYVWDDIDSPVDFSKINTSNYAYIREVGANNVDIAYYERIDISQERNNNYLLYPVFSNIEPPEGYVACFISVVKLNNVVNAFNYSNDNNGVNFLDAIELDTMLININDNIIINENNQVLTKKAKYYSSGENEGDKLKYFGNAGFISWNGQYSPPAYSRNFYIILPKDNTNDNIKHLIKLTPYINLSIDKQYVNYYYDSYLYLNSPGFVCKVNKLDREVSLTKFISGNDIFTKSTEDNLLLLDDYTDAIDFVHTDEFIIRSPFNLNCLSLTEKLNNATRTYKDANDNSKTQLIVSINSLTSSSIYQLAAMYRDYRKKDFKVIENNKFTEFNNTVRSSNIDIDEVFRNIYKFESEDYYNVPTNRGKIVNLFTIINKIYVHCEHALFVFVDNSTMKVGDNLFTSNSSDISLQETEPFKIGIQELFDSEFGYGGLKNKKHSLVTFNSYIFYDSIAKVIYAYGGESQLVPISDSIDKILKWFEPTDIYFAADNKNDRFFINIKKLVNEEWVNICLSYNFKSKAFTSIHDLDFDDSFNSRINCYFQSNTILIENDEQINKSFIYKIDNTNNGITNYNELHKTSVLTLSDVDNQVDGTIVANSIDILCNTQYENTKVLNWINWICREITEYFTYNNINLAEETGKKYSGHFIRIYSDETYSDLLPLTDSENNALEANNVALSVENGRYNPAIRTYPRYNCGIWSMNNFRDIKNDKNNSRVSDNMSLLYGKYFVIRFIFKQKNFKFENIKYNMGNYEKN